MDATYAYGSDFTLDDSADNIYLYFEDELQDAVEYDVSAGWQLTDGGSTQLKVSVFSSTDMAAGNDDANSWCLARSPYGSGDRGTPGEANTGCGSGGGL